MSEYSKEFLDLLESVTAKRPRTVIQHILQHEDYNKLIRLSGESAAQATIKRILHEHLK